MCFDVANGDSINLDFMDIVEILYLWQHRVWNRWIEQFSHQIQIGLCAQGPFQMLDLLLKILFPSHAL